jgi:RNA polymerase sigma-70 factor (ECF subfamily)
MEMEEMGQVIENTMEDLPDRCRQIFNMNRYEGLKYREIADKLKISIKTVEADMGKALQAFRHNLKVYAELK